MVHCVVWAKALYEVLFGPEDEYNYLYDLRQSAKCDVSDSSAATKWFRKLFHDDILELAQCVKAALHDLQLEKCDGPMREYRDKFLDSWARLSKAAKCVPFDKDYEPAVDFVYASANLRAANFGISHETQFKIKQIAGNIIAAISSTNAAVAAMQVLEAIKVLEQSVELRNAFISNAQSKLIHSYPALGEKPNPQVYSTLG